MKKLISALAIIITMALPLFASASTYTTGAVSSYAYQSIPTTPANTWLYFQCPIVYQASGSTFNSGDPTVSSLATPTAGADWSGSSGYTNINATATAGWYTFYSTNGSTLNGILNFSNSGSGQSYYCGNTLTYQDTYPTPSSTTSTVPLSTYDSVCVTTTSGGIATTTCDDPLKTQTGGLESFVEICILVFFGVWFLLWHGKKEIS